MATRMIDRATSNRGGAAEPVLLRNYVDGRFVDGGKPFEIFDPATGWFMQLPHEADRAIVDAAVAAARKAVEGEWGQMTLAKRRAMLNAVADGIERRFDAFLGRIDIQRNQIIAAAR